MDFPVRKETFLYFVNHGDEKSCIGFAETVTKQFALPAAAPYSGSEFDMLKGEWIRLTDPVFKKTRILSAHSPQRRNLKRLHLLS